MAQRGNQDRERDEQGRFMSEDDDRRYSRGGGGGGGGYGRGWNDEDRGGRAVFVRPGPRRVWPLHERRRARRRQRLGARAV
jgi:hypothetical protein